MKRQWVDTVLRGAFGCLGLWIAGQILERVVAEVSKSVTQAARDGAEAINTAYRPEPDYGMPDLIHTQPPRQLDDEPHAIDPTLRLLPDPPSTDRIALLQPGEDLIDSDTGRPPL